MSVDFAGSSAAGARTVQLSCRRAAWPPPATPCAPSPTRPSPPTAAASGRSRCTCPRARSSIRRSRRRSTRARRRSSASPARSWRRSRRPCPSACRPTAAGELLVLAFGGARPDGTRYVTGELVAGGAGASRGKDGVDVIETDATNCMNLPAEALELDAPIRVHRVAAAPGFGRRRRAARRARHRARIRDPARRGALHASRRAPLHRAQGPRRRPGRSHGAHGDPPHRRRRGSRCPPRSSPRSTPATASCSRPPGGGGYGDPARRAARAGAARSRRRQDQPRGRRGLRPGPQERRLRACRGAGEAWAGSDTG